MSAKLIWLVTPALVERDEAEAVVEAETPEQRHARLRRSLEVMAFTRLKPGHWHARKP